MTIFPTSISDQHLTAAPCDCMARATHPGQAHFAGTSLQPRTCRECLYWDFSQGDAQAYFTKRGRHRGRIRPARCKKFRALTGTDGPEIPDDAVGCRHFRQADKVPPRFAK
jgi:hypothetical protein